MHLRAALLLLCLAAPAAGFVHTSVHALAPSRARPAAHEGPRSNVRLGLRMSTVENKPAQKKMQKEGSSETASVDEDVKKWGFEIAMLKSLKDKSNGRAKELMAKYGKLYLTISAILSSVNYAVCYSLVAAGGPDIVALLGKFGINNVDTNTATVGGNMAIAYVFYKALAPVRMPIGIALVPIVSKVMNQKTAEGGGEDSA